MLAYLSSHMMFTIFMLGFTYGIMNYYERKQRKEDESLKAEGKAY